MPVVVLASITFAQKLLVRYPVLPRRRRSPAG
jgi:hypothetical protein